MTPPSLSESIDPGWAEALRPVSEQITEMGRFLRTETAAGRGYFPPGKQILRAFSQPFRQTRVLIVGQDPYPRPGHAVGLSFSVAPEVRPLPPSLVNIFKEYCEDLDYPSPANGDLSLWAKRGVLLLDRSLTVRPGEANLMTAGRGISHSEVSTAGTTVLHGAQLWVVLPSGAAGVEPRSHRMKLITGPRSRCPV